MSKSIRIDDKLYGLVEKFATDEDRPVANALERLIKLGLGISRPPEKKEPEPQKIGSQANRMVATGSHSASTGNEHMPVRESLPDDLEEAVQIVTKCNQDLKPEALQAWCHKMAVDEAWTDEQCQYEIEKHKTEIEEQKAEAIKILQEHNVNLGMI